MNVLRDQEDNGSQPAVGNETELDTAEAGTMRNPASDDLALRVALYGLVIQSYADKVCLMVLYHKCNVFLLMT